MKNTLNSSTPAKTSENTNDLTTVEKTDLGKIYPFINEIVDAFYTEHCNTLIDKSIQTESDKSVFLMFVMMYFCIHMKLENVDDTTKRQQIKLILSDVIRDADKRRICINMFESKFHDLFITDSEKSDNSGRLLKNK